MELTEAQQKAMDDLDNAPEYVKIALKEAAGITEAARVPESTIARLDAVVAGLMHPKVALWLVKHGFLPPIAGVEIATLDIKIHAAIARAGADS
ncbi:hypothetical protein ACFRFH_11915 [Leifsonia sp. NPDC056824]|uniref:hypothetical protein n=1 Tax=Leifsonia sp. NPDC056824 TaxID=3345953 RepID=UPI00368AC71F